MSAATPAGTVTGRKPGKADGTAAVKAATRKSGDFGASGLGLLRSGNSLGKPELGLYVFWPRGLGWETEYQRR
jgi:hypothetical protein